MRESTESRLAGNGRDAKATERTLSIQEREGFPGMEAWRDYVLRTPSVPWVDGERILDAPVWLKLENLQRTGSFKVRGATFRMLGLSRDEREAGVVTCSSGNHGRAVAWVAAALGVPATVCVPRWVDPVKLAAIRASGADAVVHGESYDEADEEAYRLAEERGLTFVHPFDDPLVIEGQGTVGVELLEDLPDLDTVVIPLSGGGLVAGIALAVKRVRPEARVVAVSAENAAVMLASVQAGAPLQLPEAPTLASALSGGIGLRNRHTFELVKELVDLHLTVTEAEISEAMRYAAAALHLVVEGGGAVGLAAVRAGRLEGRGGPVAVVVSGGNVAVETLAGLDG